MKTFELLLLLIFIFQCFESKGNKIIRQLEDESDSLLDETDNENEEIVDTASDVGVAADVGENTDIVDSTNSDNNTETDSTSTIPTNDTNSTDNGNSTITDLIDYIPPQLILLGFGNYIKKERESVEFKAFFYKILGSKVSKFLKFTLNIRYWRRLRFLEEAKVTCETNPDDTRNNIEYQCKAPIDGTKNGFTLSTEGKDFDFEDQPNTQVTVSSLANVTKNHIELAQGSYLQNALVLNNTVLDQSDKTFTLIGNLSEKINDKRIYLSLNDNANLASCSVTNLEGNSYELECVLLMSINEHLEGKFGVTEPSQRYVVLHFNKDSDDLLDIQSSNVSYDENNHFVNKKSSKKLSKGAIIGLIIAGAALLIIIGIIIACLCRKPRKTLVQETVTQIFPGQSANPSENYYH